MMEGRQLYGIAEVAKALGARPQTVAQWHRRGRLPDPDDILAMGPVWFAGTIKPWIATELERIRELEQRKNEIRAQRRAEVGAAAADVIANAFAVVIILLVLWAALNGGKLFASSM